MSATPTKQDELFIYVNAPDYLKEKVRHYGKEYYDKDNFNIWRQIEINWIFFLLFWYIFVIICMKLTE